MTPETSCYNATLFRFPLRQSDSESRITKTCYSPQKVKENLFSSLKVEAPKLLLFLKSVLKVSIYEWDEISNSPSCKFCVSISETMRQYREECYKLAEEYDTSSESTTALLSTATTECFEEEVSEKQRRKMQYHWLIINSMGSDATELRMLAEKMKVLPWVGIACPVAVEFDLQGQTPINLGHVSERNELMETFSRVKQLLPRESLTVKEANSGYKIDGQAFCFLPLPGATALPVNLHGYFAVADNRSSIKWPSHDEKGEEAKWNKLLLDKVIAPLYALLLACRSCLLSYSEVSAEACQMDAYAAWPVHAEIKNQVIWREILQPVLTMIADLPVLWTEAEGGTWISPKEAYFQNPDKMPPEIALRVLIEEGCKVVVLPSEIFATLQTNTEIMRIITSRYVTPELVRSCIRGKRNDISQEEVYDLLDYVLSSSPSFTSLELKDIHLVPLSNKQTCPFSPVDDKNVIFIFTEKYKNALEFLPGISSIIIDTDIPSKVQDKLETIAVQEAYQLRIPTANDICDLLLKKSLQSWSDFGDQLLCVWKPGTSGHPTFEWVNKLWSWIISNDVPLSKMKHVPIIPQEPISPETKQVSLFPLSYNPGLCILPDRLPCQCSHDIMLKFIDVLGFISVHKSDIVFQAQGIKEYIKSCDARFIVNQLIKTESTFSFSQSLSNIEKDALCHLIAHDFSQEVHPNECACIKSLQIFQAGVGASSVKYIRLDSSYILPPLGITFECDILYPPEILNYDPQHNPQLYSFLRRLKLKCLGTIDEFCAKIVFPFVLESYESHSDEMFKLVMWMLKLPLTNQQFLQGRKFIESSADPRKLKDPIELYDPEDKVITLFFDRNTDDVFPADKYRSVLPILRCAGMRTWDSLKSNQHDMLSFMIDRAKSVSTLNKEEGLKRSKMLLLYLLSFGLLENSQLSKIRFLFLEKNPPLDYLPQLSWYGREHSDEKVSAQSVCFRASDSYIVGSILPILSSEYDKGNIINSKGFHKIVADEVVCQFTALSEVVSSSEKKFDHRDAANVTKAVFQMYEFLISKECCASVLPKKWIWWKNNSTLLAPEDCILNVPLHFSLEPFVFSLSSDSDLCHKVFAILPKHEFQQTLSTSKAVNILHSMSRESLSTQNLNIAIGILQWLKEQHYKPQGDILIPTNQSTLVVASECTYDDRNWTRDKADMQKISKCLYVHENMSPALAKYFCVTALSSRIAPSQKIRLKYTKAGQHEPITRRIKGIVEDYATSSDIFKELLQNADDARATEVKFLIDWRNHSANTLLTEELQVWQGPALIAYNNSVFSDEDFEHICKLAAETKQKDPSKTGRFGIGFCSTYQITDVPCFISRRYFTMFDPHTTHLRDRVSHDEPGMRIDLIENRDDLLVYEDQFLPYNNVFGCQIFQLPDEGYRGTLFRFPFRCTKTARKSKICDKIVGRKQIDSIVTSFKKEAPHLLLFLKHVTKVSVSILEEGANPKEMVTIIDVEKSCEYIEYGRMDLIDRYVERHNSEGVRNVEIYNSEEMRSVESHCTISTRVHSSNGTKVSNSNWLINSTVDAKPLPTSLKNKGLVPFAEVAIQVEKKQSHLIPKPLEGYAFCFLPLPIKTGLPFHVNGFFDVNHDRSGIRSTDDERFGRVWNESLCKGALTQAFIVALSLLAKEMNLEIMSEEEKREHLDSYYKFFDLSGKKNLIGEALSESVAQDLPTSECELIWSDVSNGKWLYPNDVILLDLESQAREMQECTVQVFLELERNICVTSKHICQLILRYRKKCKLGQVFSYHAFCTDLLMPNISEISLDLRDKHILFLLKQLNNFPWINDMMQKRSCIPVQCSLALRLPKETIDNKKELMSRIYEPDEGHFPAVVLQEPHIMAALRQLGMVHVLSIKQIKERAVRVAAISPLSKAIDRAWLILQYIEKEFLKYSPYSNYAVKLTDKGAKLREALDTVEFIPTAQCPSSIQLTWWDALVFTCPNNICLPKYNNLVFTQQPVVVMPEDLHLSPQVLLCTSDPPPLTVVIDHLLSLISSSDQGVDEHTKMYINSAMKDIYKYLEKKLCPHQAWTSSKQDIDEAKQRLGDEKVVWQESHFLNVSQVFYHWNHDCYPYLCGLSSENKTYHKLFSLLGMKEEPPVPLLINVLCNIATDYPPVNQVPEDIISFIEAIVKKICYYLKQNDKPSPNIFLPDEKGVMRCVKQLACDRVIESSILPESGEEYYFVHDSIPRQRALKLGVRPLLDTLLRSIEKEIFLMGTDFGQHEDLCHRLESILTKYPADCSILNEFIQNADDAGASEIVFVLDKRSHPQKNLLSHAEQWENLQSTPALCIFNNKMFQEEDIKGITHLGKGAKSDSAETIGKFGIGFNVAYHITDCPSFVSFNEEGDPDKFCFFDPTCSYAEYASRKNPGRSWDISKRPTVVKDFPHQFQPYLMNDLEPLSHLVPSCLQNVCEQGYVVFRLPLTRQRQHITTPSLPNEYHKHSPKVSTRQQGQYSPMSSNEYKKRVLNVPKIFDEKSVHKLLFGMKDLASDTMLFLQHIRKMSAFEISPEGKYSLLFSTQSSMPHKEAQKCCEFHKMRRNVSLNEKKVLTLSNTTIISHTTPDSNNDLVTSKVRWLVNWRYNTVDIEQSLLQTAFQCHLRPLGGVAAPIGVNRRHHFLFCFLPMPLESGHPVHLNGHFLVDDSRKHLETKVHQGLDDWNRSLAVKVIAPCYRDLLLQAQIMTKNSETDHQWFYSLFPTVKKEGEVGELKLAKAVYSGLLDINPKILLQILPVPNGPDIRTWCHLKGNGMGFFFCSFISKCTGIFLNANEDVKKALVCLGMPITTEAPMSLYENLCFVDSNYGQQARVDPYKVIAHLNLLQQSKLQAVLARKDTLQHLLQFLVDGMEKQDLRKALTNVPLLLACDGVLKKGPTLFNSKYMSLLPSNYSAYFIDEEIESSKIGKVLAREDYKVVIPLEVSFMAKYIALRDTNQAIPLDSLSSDEVNLIKQLWHYLTKNDISFHELCAHFSKKPLIPTEDQLIFPVCLAKTVLCKICLYGNPHIWSALKKLGYSILSFDVLDMHLENWAQVLSVNACSNGNDIISCFSTISPLNCNVEFTKEEVRAIIENLRVLRNELRMHNIKLLQRLKLYETFEGDFTSVERKYNVVIAHIPREMPLTELIILQEKFNNIFLRMKDSYISLFYETVVPRAIVINDVCDFYIRYVIPYIMEFSDDALEKHLEYINYYYHSRDSRLMRQLKETKFVKIDGHQFKPVEVYDPNCEFSFFFETFCGDNILPLPWSEKKWQPFFKELGMRQTVSCAEWLLHARKFAETELSTIHYEQLQCKSMALLKALFLMIEQKIICNDTCRETFLKEVSKVKFIYNPSLPPLELLVQTVFKNKTLKKHQMFCFQHSVISLESHLAALCRNILPECCNETLLKHADVRQALYIEYPVQLSTVVENLKCFSEKYSHLQSVLSTIGEEQSRAMNTMSVHYEVLNKASEHGKAVELQSLKNVKCIAVGKSSSQSSFHLIEPSLLVMSHDIHLEPFCYSVPDILRQYSNFWEALSVPKTLTANRCADILQIIYYQLEECETKLSENDDYKKIALDAYNSLVLIQRADGEEDLPNQLFLPSEDDELLPNDKLLHNNANWYAQRLPKKHVSFLKLPPPDKKGERDPPASLGVQLLTDVVTEELHPDMYSSDVACTKETLYATRRKGRRCEYVNKIHSTLVSSHLRAGLIRVYFEEHKEKPSLEFLNAVQNLQHIDIKCVMSDAISTLLFVDRKILKHSRHQKYCQVSFSEETPQIWIAPHGPFDTSRFLESLCRAMKLLLNNQIKNEAHLMAMFDCHPNEIEEALDQRQVGPYSPNQVKETKYSKVGDKLPKDSINCEEYLIILNFETEEKVKYQDPSGVLILAEVSQVLPSNLLYEKTIAIRTKRCKETEECISVSPLSLFKNLTPSQRIYLSKKPSHSASKFISPLCMAEVPDTQDKLFEWLDAIHNSTFFSEQSIQVKLLILERIQKHLVYVLKGDEKQAGLHHLQCFQREYLDSENQRSTQYSTQVVSNTAYSCKPNLAQQFPPQQSQLCSQLQQQVPQMMSNVPNSPQRLPIQQSQPRFQSRQRRGYQPQQRRSRFQPEVHIEQPSSPPVSVRDAQIWFDQAKADYKAAEFLMAQITLSLRVVMSPERCYSEEENKSKKELIQETSKLSESDEKIDDEVHFDEYKGANSIEYSCFQVEEQKEYGTSSEVQCSSSNSCSQPHNLSCVSRPEMEESNFEIYSATNYRIGGEDKIHDLKYDKEAAESSRSISQGSECSVEENSSEIDVPNEDHDDEVRSKPSSQVSSQYPALVCFLCHETVEKCLKGALYTYCGLSPDLVNCSTLVSLLEAFQSSEYSPKELLHPIQECVMHMNEHENKSRLPNYQIPPCAPAAVYTPFNANGAFHSTRSLLQHLMGDSKLNVLLGDLGELPKTKFTSLLKAMAGTDTGNI